MNLKDYGKYVKMDKRGTVIHLLHNKLHRKDGPAVIHKSGLKEYYLHGKLQKSVEVNGIIRICHPYFYTINPKQTKPTQTSHLTSPK